MRSEVIEQMPRQRKSLHHLLQFLLLSLVVKGYQLDSLEHVTPIERYLLPLREILLEDVDEGLEDDLFDVVVAVLFVDRE
jgi:hypothetical protein